MHPQTIAFAIALASALALSPSHISLRAQDRSDPQAPQLIRFEAFIRSDRESAKQVQEYVDDLNRRVSGLEVHVHDVLKDQTQLRRLYELSKLAGRDKPVIPAFHSCDRTYFGFVNAHQTGPAIERLLTADLYTRSTCSRCQQLKAFLPALQNRWPAIRFVVHDVDRSASARATWQSLCRGAGSVPGLPTIDFARRIIIGYQGDDVTGAQLEALIKKVSGANPAKSPLGAHARGFRAYAQQAQPGRENVSARRRSDDERVSRVTSGQRFSAFGGSGSVGFVSTGLRATVASSLFFLQSDAETANEQTAENEEALSIDLLELPDEAVRSEIGEGDAPSEVVHKESIDVPFFGELDASRLGMPLFTLAVGLVDGFNPCAMWVLVFLLSVLVNIKDRRKILVIAGTFVIISGLAYFAFMAAWLNIFLLVGIARPVQIALGLLALLIGTINVKDFFAFKKGISLSIPESQKPGLYRRVREIASAKYLSVALTGAVALAVIVNMIELLCTAGLPALYTQVLTLQEYPTWKNYAYLLLYISAYMLDDALLVAIVVTTLSHRRLQEREGRWLKLVSGLVILVLGLVMLFRPAWLALGT
jgi:hypothetical protein